MIRRIFFFLFFLSCVSVDNYDYSNIKIIEVIDGDTVRLSNGKFLRYIGLDAPEIRIKKENTFVYSPQAFALEAKEFNRKLVEGKTVRIEFDIEKTDRYGRLLGYCFLGETFVNAKLIEEGFANIYTKPPNVKYVDLFVKLQKQARENKKGLWGVYEVISHDRAALFLNQIRTVRGKVINTYKTDKCIFLNFDKDYKKDFTVVIFNDDVKYFYKKGIKPESFYLNKIVEVSGKITEYNGPEIIIHSPYDISVVESN